MSETLGTNTRIGVVRHLRFEMAGGFVAAPVALVTKKPNGLWQRADANGRYLPKVRGHRFVHILPGGQEVLGAVLDSIQREKLKKIEGEK